VHALHLVNPHACSPSTGSRNGPASDDLEDADREEGAAAMEDMSAASSAWRMWRFVQVRAVCVCVCVRV